MKPISDMPAERACSDRTRLEVQEYTAHRTIRAAQRAVQEGDARDLDRDLCISLAAYQAELRFNGPRVFARHHATSRNAVKQPRDESSAEQLQSDVQAELDAIAARHPELAAEIEHSTAEFLARFAPSERRVSNGAHGTRQNVAEPMGVSA